MSDFLAILWLFTIWAGVGWIIATPELTRNEKEGFAKEICGPDYNLSKTQRVVECSGTVSVNVVIKDGVPKITINSPYMTVGK